MAKYCPILEEYVVYLTCQECEEKSCKQKDSTDHKTKEGEKP